MSTADRVAVMQGQARQLPWSQEAEQAVLGSLLLWPDCRSEVFPILDAADFYDSAHAAIYAAMRQLDADSRPIDALQVEQQLQRDDTAHRLRARGGPHAYAVDLTGAVVAVDNVAWHARIVAGKALVRRVIEATQAIYAAGYGDTEDPADFADRAAVTLAAIARGRRGGALSRPIGDVLQEVLREAEEAVKRQEAGKPPVVIPTGFGDLDAMLYGWEPGTLNIEAARPSQGKTALMMDHVEAAAMSGWPAYVGTREMRDVALVRRRLAGAANIEHSRLRRVDFGAPEWARLSTAAARLAALPVEISRPFYGLVEFESGVRLWRAHKTDPNLPALATLDYLQLLSPPPQKGQSRNREQEVSEMSRRLKGLAQELNLALLVLSQLSRANEKENRRPRNSDLRDSGGIEQDADVIAFIHRPNGQHKPEAELLVTKQRNGPIGDINLLFDAPRVRFIDGDAQARLPPAPRRAAVGGYGDDDDR